MSRSHKIGLIILSLIFIIGGIYFFTREGRFSPDDVIFELQGIKEIKAGEPQDIKIICQNNSKRVLKNLKLSLVFPQGILDSKTAQVPKTNFDLENLLPGQQIVQKLQLSFFGKIDDLKTIKGSLEFSPQGLKKTYSKEHSLDFLIKSVPLHLVFFAPSLAVSSQEINFSFRYLSKADFSLPNFAVKMLYPTNFSYLSAKPKPSKEDNLWIFNNLKPKAEGEIEIRGKLEGMPEEIKRFKVQLGIMIENQFLTLIERETTIKIAQVFLQISQFINGKPEYSANLGEALQYLIKYKNNTREKLREVFITLNLESEALDFNEIEVKGGEFISQTRTIVWKAAGVPGLLMLAPGQSGQVEFRIKVKDTLPIKSPEDKNFTVISKAKIDMNPLYLPLSLKGFKIASESISIVKINSQVSLEAKSYYQHPEISNSGPIPPKVGKITTYAISWKISNLSNDLREVVVEGKLPSNIIWKENFKPENEKLKYEQFTGKIVWKIDELKAGSGFILPKKEVSFQVAVQPGPELKGKLITLVDEINLSGKDSFTGKILTRKVPKITTALSEEESDLGEKSGIVQP